MSPGPDNRVNAIASYDSVWSRDQDPEISAVVRPPTVVVSMSTFRPWHNSQNELASGERKNTRAQTATGLLTPGNDI